jgi:hypothetical protein
MQFLGIEWHPACLEFQNNARSVTTISRWQVRQPVYSTSVGKWKQFEPWLGPLIESLGDLARDQRDKPGDDAKYKRHARA